MKQMHQWRHIEDDWVAKVRGEHEHQYAISRELVSADAGDDLTLEELPELVALFRRSTILGKLQAISSQLESMSEQIARTPSFGKIVHVQHIDDASISLVKPFAVTVTEVEEGYLCQFVDCNINAAGETTFEAVENLKALVVANYKRWSAAPPERLGPMPALHFRVLREFLKPDG